MENSNIETKSDFLRRTQSLNDDTKIQVSWSYPEVTMWSQNTPIISSGYIMSNDPTKFRLEIQNPLETEMLHEYIKPCLEWMKSHGANEDEFIKWKFQQLSRMSGLKDLTK